MCNQKARSRRDEYAELTKKAIAEAARKLFSERGFFATKVDEIAALARVAPATVYAVSGGKQGLLRALIEDYSTASIIAETLEHITKSDDPKKALRTLASACRMMREEHQDTIRVMLDTAPHDQTVADAAAIATARYRRALLSITQHLSGIGGLRDDISLTEGTDILWFYFGYTGLFVLHDDNGWSYEQAEAWLFEQASRALLRDP